MAILLRLTPETIPGTWPRIEPMIAGACERSNGRFTAPLILSLALRGPWQIWLAVTEAGIAAVAGTELVTYPTGLQVIAFRFCTGGDRSNWQHLVEQIIAWGRDQGCARAEGTFRIGWRRALSGWTHRHDSLERDL